MNLNSSVEEIPLVGGKYAQKLEKLGIFTIEDLFHLIPHRYLDFRTKTEISNIAEGETLTVSGKIESAENVFTFRRKNFQVVTVNDGTGSVQAIWFNQPYLAKTLKNANGISISGTVSTFNKKLAFISPEYELILTSAHEAAQNVHTGRLVPVYPTTAGVSSKWLRSRINYVFNRLNNDFEEFLPEKVLRKFDLELWEKAIQTVHFPKELDMAETGKKRLAFNELLYLQLQSLIRKIEWQENLATYKLKIEKKYLEEFISKLPFSLTESQLRSIKELQEDLKKDKPMNRLLEGDVGSGKTIVAAMGAFASFINGYQTIVMAPTQILAQQHFNTLKNIFEPFKVRISLVTSAGVQSDFGKTDIWVGTHALIHKSSNFDKLGGYSKVALVVIDEQHRFGVEQRTHLVKKTGSKRKAPHVLTMTATPIPRTIALTVYGDLDLSTLDELPQGRKPITTWIVPPQKREGAYGWIKKQITEDKIQVFVLCPLIEESESETMKTVKAATVEFKRLKSIFPEFQIGLLHGRQKVSEKNEVLDRFKNGVLNILVTTPVVEVGIDIPNATIMLIEASERFGLAQLHQLRGRVGRGDKKSYCLLFTESKSPKALTRLKALTKTTSGFELAELDLKMRGPGEVLGTKQHGFPELKIASWQDTELIKAAKNVAEDAIKNQKAYIKLFEKMGKSKIVLN